jgi:hypothetical protein
MLQYSPKITTDGLVMCLDASQNKSYPTDLPVKNGLLVWLDAADDSTFSYSSGTEVSQWRDKSGNNLHANQATTANQPSRNTVVNSRKSVNFTSTNGDRLRVNSGMVFTNSVTAIVFIKPGSQNYAYANILDQDHGMDGANGWVIQRNNDASAWLSWVANAAGDTWFNPNQILYVDNTPQIVTLRKGSSTVTLYSNGTSSTDVAIADQQIRQVGYLGLNLGSWRAGNEIHGSPRHYNGEICEVVVYNRALSLTELKQVHTYLGQKWGISNTDRSIIDLSGFNDNGLLGDGTTANMPVYDYYNKGAFRFDGSNDFIKVGPNSSLQVNNVTIAAFFKTVNNGQSVQFIAGYGDTGIAGYWIGTSGGPIRFSIGGGSGNYLQQSSGVTPNNDQIYYVVGTYDGTNQRVYVNGVLQASATTVTGNISYTGLTDGFLVGQVQGFTAGRYLTGSVYNVSVYSRALSQAEISQNYEALKSKFANTIVQQGLVLNLDAGNPYSYAGAGTTFYDVSGNGKIGTLTGGVTYSSLYGGDFILDGVNGYIQTDLNQNTDNAQITWEAWFWDNSPGGFVSNTAIISNYGAVGTTPYTSLHILDTGNVFFGQRNSSGTADDAVYGSSICDSVWHHLVGVVDGSNMHIYVDGIVRASKTKITGTTTSGQNLVIGGNHLGRYQSCRIASARCYNIALSAAQVLQNYNATKGRFGL